MVHYLFRARINNTGRVAGRLARCSQLYCSWNIHCGGLGTAQYWYFPSKIYAAANHEFSRLDSACCRLKWRYFPAKLYAVANHKFSRLNSDWFRPKLRCVALDLCRLANLRQNALWPSACAVWHHCVYCSFYYLSSRQTSRPLITGHDLRVWNIDTIFSWPSVPFVFTNCVLKIFCRFRNCGNEWKLRCLFIYWSSNFFICPRQTRLDWSENLTDFLTKHFVVTFWM